MKRWPQILCHSSHWEVDSNSFHPLETGLVLVNALTNRIWQKWHSSSCCVQAFQDFFHILSLRRLSLGALSHSPCKNSSFPKPVTLKKLLVNALIESQLSPAFQPCWQGPRHEREVVLDLLGQPICQLNAEDFCQYQMELRSCPALLDSWPMKSWNIIQRWFYEVVGVVGCITMGNWSTWLSEISFIILYTLCVMYIC